MKKLKKYIFSVSIFVFTFSISAFAADYKMVQKKALDISRLYDQRADVDKFIAEFGTPSYVIEPKYHAKLNLSYFDGSNTYLVWSHFGCTHSFVAFDETGMPRGLFAEWSGFSEDRAKLEGCPDGFFVRESKLFAPYSCAARSSNKKYCKSTSGANSKSQEAQRYFSAVKQSIKEGQKLISSKPSNDQIGAHSRKIKMLIDDGRKFQDPSPNAACAVIGAAAWNYWIDGLVAKFNRSKDSDTDLSTFKIRYEARLKECQLTFI